MSAKFRLLTGVLALAVLAAGCTTTVSGTPTAGAQAPTSAARPSSTGRPGAPPEADKSSETVVALMKKIQETDICALHDQEFLKKFGPKVVSTNGPGFNGCAGIGGTPNAEHFWLFELVLGAPYEPKDRNKDKSEDVGGRKIYFPTISGTNDDTCHAKIQLGQTDFGATLRARMVPNTGKPAPWPERCQQAGAYLALLAPKLESPPARTAAADGRLLGKDPCAKKDQIVGLYPEYQLQAVEYVSPYDCRIRFVKGDEPLKLLVSVSWDRDDEPSLTSFGSQRVEKIEMGGLSGIRRTSADVGRGGSCFTSLTVKPGEKDVKFSAHLVQVEADLTIDFSKPATGKPVPPAPCGPVNQATELVLSGI
ncbi:hypothetical protein [Crossiella sp. CA198]|uniref:hypothetical protein n=1 Tax=Crossiella sp. CA198 TaxID=3455607 RepID=UPI003F8CFB31